MKKKFLKIIFVLSLLFFSLESFAITIDISAVVPGCGNGTIESGEQCDGSNLGGSSCVSLGFTSGGLSCSSACTFNTASCSIATPNSIGGGGGGSKKKEPTSDTNVVFSGRAYPLSRVGILKDGQLVVTTIAGPDSNFTATISGLSKGNYTFAVYGEDKNNLRSSLFNFPIYITSGVTTKIGGIFIAPTIALDKKEVRKGDNIAVFGQSSPSTEVLININSTPEFLLRQNSDANGVYLLNFDSSLLEIGKHSAKSKASLQNEITEFSKTVGFLVGSQSVFANVSEFTNTGQDIVKGDLNSDKKINLVDFSIAAFWYKKTLSGNILEYEKIHLNGDGKIDLIDFSIMAFHWTG
jgi:hypothetical protein